MKHKIGFVSEIINENISYFPNNVLELPLFPCQELTKRNLLTRGDSFIIANENPSRYINFREYFLQKIVLIDKNPGLVCYLDAKQIFSLRNNNIQKISFSDTEIKGLLAISHRYYEIPVVKNICEFHNIKYDGGISLMRDITLDFHIEENDFEKSYTYNKFIQEYNDYQYKVI
jgi:hypothetical protein